MYNEVINKLYYMAETISDHYAQASAEARQSDVEFNGINIGSLPLEGLNAEQSQQVLSILHSWGIAESNLADALDAFAQHYNEVFGRNLAPEGLWGSQPRLAMEIYALAISAWRESVGDMNALAFRIERQALQTEVEEIQTRTPETARNVEAEYNAVRSFLRGTRDAHGTFALQYPLPNGDIVETGRINTNIYGHVPEEHHLVPVLNDLGFDSFSRFAQAYNQRFSHRNADSQQLILANARSVDQRMNREDIRVGDEAFRNVRLALQIWITHERMPQQNDNQVTFGVFSFSLDQLQRYIPEFADPNKAVIANQEQAQFLQRLIEFSPNRTITPLSDRFTHYEETFADIQPGEERSIDPAVWQEIAAEIQAQDFVFSIAPDPGIPIYQVDPTLKTQAENIARRIDRFILVTRSANWGENHDSLGRQANQLCNGYYEGTVSSFSCYDGP